VRATQNFSWKLVGTAGEHLLTPQDVRAAYAGIIFVGDSQIREVAWAALQLFTPGQEQRFADDDPVFAYSKRMVARSAASLASACVPQTVGKTGFTAVCGKLGRGSCHLYSPFANRTHAEAMRKLLLTRPHDWDGRLSVSSRACMSDFFVSYQATWGAVPIVPTSLPKCMHPLAEGGSYGLGGGKRRTVRKPILWVIDGGGLHEMEFCAPQRHTLPQIVLSNFAPTTLRESVVWQPVGGGFLMRSSRRFKGECALIDADQIAAKEMEWLSANGVRHYPYTKLTLQFAPLLFDAIHFTYYWVPCAKTFPEMARFVALLGVQEGLKLPIRYCSAAEVDSLGSVSEVGGLPLGIAPPSKRMPSV